MTRRARTNRYTILIAVAILIFNNVTGRAEQNKPGHRLNSYPNVLTFNFPQFVAISQIPFLNIGAEYERLIDRRGNFSMSVSMYGGAAPGPYIGADLFGAFGCRFYPVRGRKADVSVGLQVASGTLELKKDEYPLTGGKSNGSMTAFLLQSDLCLHPTSHGVLGLHIAVGTDVNEVIDNGLMFQIGLKVGGRF